MGSRRGGACSLDARATRDQSRFMRRLVLGLGLAAAVWSCSGGGSDSASPSAEQEAGPGVDGGTAADGAPLDASASPSACPRALGQADRPRKIVVSHPFKEGGGKTGLFEVLDLGTDGTITRPGVTFEMHPAFSAIAFTPDGQVGLVAQDDGTLGVFAFDAAGAVRVVHAAFKANFSASHVVVSRDGARAFILDPQSPTFTGGVHEVAIGCDGTLTYVGFVVPGGFAHAMTLMPNDPDRAVLVGRKALDSADGAYVHRLDFAGASPKRLASGKAFDDDGAIASHVAVTLDGKYALVTDNGFEKGNRMVAVALDTMTPGTPITTPSPAAAVMSPFGNAALLLNSDGTDALRVVRYSPNDPATPFAITGEITYVGKKTELPTFAHVVDRGALRGRVVVSEVTTLRQVRFAPEGTVTDLGQFDLGGGSANIVGSMGAQP
jgi:DNA-binding beta-propeller fold protein YncE